jgi:hypothetical protein
VRGNGLDYTVEWRRDVSATAAAIEAGSAIVDTLRFPALSDRDEIGGWVPLGPSRQYEKGRGTPSYADRLIVIYVMRGPNGDYALDLEADSCGEGSNDAWDPDTLEIVLECPDGGDMRFDRFGDPDPDNAPEFAQPLHAYPVITPWNGTLLLYRDGQMDDLPEQRWP